MKNIKYLFIILLILFSACGEGIVDFNQSSYEPKIAIEGFLFPGATVKNIKVMRNIPINTLMSSYSMNITNADIKITELSSGKVYPLSYNQVSGTYENNNLTIQYGTSYGLNCVAKIDSKELSTYSETITPLKGMAINKDLSKPDKLFYTGLDKQQGDKNFQVIYNTSPGTSFYAISIKSMDPSSINFIQDNLWNIDSSNSEIKNHPERFNQSIVYNEYGTSVNQKVTTLLEWYNFYYYGKYRVILYACDKNMKDYLVTYQNVMEMDGNLHEPIMNFKGDGIGVFGSAIADTIYFEITRK